MPFDLAARIEAWRTQLLDTTKRNRLINFKTGRGGGIAFVHPDPGDLWHFLVTQGVALPFPWKRDLIELPPDVDEHSRDGGLTLFDFAGAPEAETGQAILERCRNSPRLRPEHLLTDLPDNQLRTRLSRLALNSRESLTEQGVAILYVAFGFLRWFDSPDSQVEIRSPLLLVPVRLERDNIEAPWRLQAEEDEVLLNHSLRQLLATDFRLPLPAPEEAGDMDDPSERTIYFAKVQQAIRHLLRWEVLDEAALGAFSFQKLAMWEDLGRSRELIAGHDLCRAIAGDQGVALRFPADLPKVEELDRQTHPKQTYHILDADGSQHEAIAAATRGASLVLDGPPGTGKSQTIANIIAEFLAAGKTVLFVSEKAAALEVVQRRLQDRGLGDFYLACHSHKANKREVVAELGRCLAVGAEGFRGSDDDLQALYEARRQLNDYVRQLHAPRQPLGMTVFQVHGELARLSRLGSKSRCPIPDVLRRDAAYLQRVTDVLARLPDCQAVIECRDRHPWRGCRAKVFSQTLLDDVRHHFGRLADRLGPILETAGVLHRHGFGAGDPTRAQWLSSLESARTVLACPPAPAAWFRGDARTTAEGVVLLNRLTQAYRQTLASMPEFSQAALRQADAASLRGLAAPADGGPRLIPRLGDTVRAQRPRLAAAGASLCELQRLATAADQASQRVEALLGARFPAQPVKALRKLAELTDLIARTKPVRRPWWDVGRRKELRGVIERWQAEARAAQDLRAELAVRLSPRAFAPESAGLAARANWFRSFIVRLLPQWWSVHAEVTGWYGGQAPQTAALMDDMAKLTSYHRRIDYCRQVREQYAAELVLGGDGEPDWTGTLEGLASVDRLEKVGKIPAPIQAILSAEGVLDREALAEAAKQLGRQAEALRRQAEAATREYDLGDVTDGTPQHIRLTARDLAAWLGGQVTAVNQRAALLDRVVGLLREESDLPVEALLARVRSAGDAAKVREQISAVAGRLWPSQAPVAVEESDWSALGRVAESVLGLIQRLGGPLPAATVQALTAPQVRGQLEEAVRRCDGARASGFDESWQYLSGLFDVNQEVSAGIIVERAPLSELRRWLAERAGDAHRIHEWTLFCDVQAEVARAGVYPILGEVLDGLVRPTEAGAAFRARFLRVWLDATYEQTPTLRQFASDNHERLIGRFRELDRRSVDSAAVRIRNAQLSRSDRPRLLAANAPDSSIGELGTLLRQVNMKRRHLPLRKLFAALPTLLPRLKPCLMMSPLAVSTYLNSPDFEFDLVIFDEASQVRPHDAMCAIYRGRQLIVAGDQKQLPPTSFFDRALEDDGLSSEGDDGEGGLEDYESILDVCCTLGMPRRRLRWHYRSRREGLIAFSNRYVYDNELVTFPSVHDVEGHPAVAFEHVKDGRWKPGPSGGFNAVEARRTAELVLAHFRDKPAMSLGVIAFSQRQQMRILDELERLRQDNPELEEFFKEDRDEPFFVKNLENVQGDERDVIFLGVGYGPDETGRVAMRFGPLNQQGGERRLNVAVTRARQAMVVVSSLRAQHLDLSRTGAVGVKLFRAYLDYAERGTEALRSEITEAGQRGFDSPFEWEVFDELIRHGLTVHPQVGCSSFHIDLAVVDPTAPGRYLLGVECDGATYHSSATARDRDRLRQQVLEDLGWRICRIWSTDWLRDREGQIRRVQAALEEARLRQDATPPVPPPQPKVRPAEDRTGAADAEAAHVVTEPPPPTPNYNSIDDVPDSVLRDKLRATLQAVGATESRDLIQSVARKLGFRRTGSRIQERIERCLDGLIQAGHVSRMADQRLQLGSVPRAASM
jgi:very-short-patch-repair endonuclease